MRDGTLLLLAAGHAPRRLPLRPCLSGASHVGDYRHHVERAKDERLDRQDGTGRGHEVAKKGGAGKANWGVEGDRVTE